MFKSLNIEDAFNFTIGKNQFPLSGPRAIVVFIDGTTILLEMAWNIKKITNWRLKKVHLT
jgi:hypothetical protein